MLEGMRKKRFVLRRMITVCLIVVLAGFCVLEGIVIVGGRSSEDQSGDVLLILGAQVYQDGKPSPVLRNRLDTALDWLAVWDDASIPIIVSGGQGSDEPESEAQAMERYLVNHGVAPNRIYQEAQSKNTMQNLENSMALLSSMEYDLERTRVIIVSNNFHLARVRMLAERCGIQTGTAAAPMPDLPSTLFSYSRETLALVKSFLLDEQKEAAGVKLIDKGNGNA